jgi:hypothetical protein
MSLLELAKKPSPWAQPEPSEFQEDFDLAAEYRAIRERDDFERELGPSTMEYLAEIYDCEPAPISRIQGEKLGLLLKRYIKWCEELGVCAIPGNQVWVAAFLHEMREESHATDADLYEMSEAISRGHYLHGYPNPTAHPAVHAVLGNLRRQPTKETEEVAYERKNPIEAVTTSKTKLPSPKELELDQASESPFWDKANEVASGQAEHNPTFSKPHNASKGQK